MILYDKEGVFVFFLIYVDDILVIGNDSEFVSNIIIKLNIVFSLNDLGELNFFMVIEVTITLDGFHLCQPQYIKDHLDHV